MIKRIEDYEEMLQAMLEEGIDKERAEKVIEESYILGLLDVPKCMN